MYFWLIVTALLWGLTDPLLKRFGQEDRGRSEAALTLLLTNWKYTLTFIANQCGSLTYILAVQGGANLSIVVPVANGLKFAFTFLMGRVLGEKDLSLTTTLGVFLVLAGVSLQMTSS